MKTRVTFRLLASLSVIAMAVVGSAAGCVYCGPLLAGLAAAALVQRVFPRSNLTFAHA